MDQVADLAAERRGLLDQVAAVPRPGAELEVILGDDGLGQAEAVDGGAVDGRQVGVVGLAVGVGGLAELLGGERMDDADLEAGGGEGPLGRVMEPAGALDDDDHIFDRTHFDLNINCLDGLAEAAGVVLQYSGWDEHVSLEVGHHPLGPRLGGVDGDDGEVLGPDGLDAGVEWITPWGVGSREAEPRERGERGGVVGADMDGGLQG